MWTVPYQLQLTAGLLFVITFMTGLWLVQRASRNAGIVDIGWSASVGLLGVFYAATSGGDILRRMMAGFMIGLWSARLTVYLFRRVVGEPEEGRYATLRAKWGQEANRRFFRFFQMQAAAAFIFALPVFVAAWIRSAPSGVAVVASVVIWSVGMGGVALADRQLEVFKSAPASRGKTCRVGLWHYSRHPNYFFEWVHWWAYLPLAIGSSLWWIALVVPVLLLYFILFVTGVPPTEAQALASRGDDYRRYQKTTSPFLPWFPRKESA